VAVHIDRVEREFILSTAAETRTEARLRAEGRSIRTRVVKYDSDSVEFAVEGACGSFRPREPVSVCFDFRGQAVAFEAVVLEAGASKLVLEFPESMYRSLSRRWTRVSKPRGLSVDFLLRDAELSLDCPLSEEWVDVELPELRSGLDSKDLTSLVESFKVKAQGIAGEGHVVMFKERGPADIAEEMSSRIGRVLFVPLAAGDLPLVDPYPAGRIITKRMAEDFEGAGSAEPGSKLSRYLAERARRGLQSALWCPIVYYRYAVGVVHIANDRASPMPLDFDAVDLAWEFSRVLAWFLKRHRYFVETEGSEATKRGSIVDASPAGILAVLPSGGPGIGQGSVIRLRLGLRGRNIVCFGKVARRYDEGGLRFCGIAFMDLSTADKAQLSACLYGDKEGVEAGLEAGA